MRTDPIFNLKSEKKSKSKFVILGLLITGLISFIIIVTTIYGQFTGTFLITMSHDAEQKGIKLSLSEDFIESEEKLSLIPIAGIEDLLEENIVRIDEILAGPGGHYEDPDGMDDYIAYNFYLKNTGEEVINLRYYIRIVEAYKKLDDALTVILYEVNEDGEPIKEVYRKEGSKLIGEKIIYNFRPQEVKKFTLIAFADGRFSTPEMLGGGVKVTIVFTLDTESE